MKSQRLQFENQQGHKLAARLELPETKTKAYALFAHCFTCSKNLKAVNNIAKALTQEGIAVLRFDFTGLGESEGDFADSNFSSNVDDLVAAADFLSANFEAPQLLIGHSLGGAAVLQAAERIPSSKAVVTLGAPSEPVHVEHLLESKRDEIEQTGQAELSLAGRRFTIKKQFLDDLKKSHMRELIGKLDRALLVMHSPTDNTVSVDNAADIFTAAKHPKSFVSLDHADHLLSREQDSLYAGKVMAGWAERYLDLAEPPQNETVSDAYVLAQTKAGYRTELQVAGFHFLADEPLSVGGTGLAPSPTQYLLAALAACTSITLRMYADMKKWALDSITVTVNHQKVTDQEDDKPASIDQFEVGLELLGDLDEKQRKRLLDISKRCPVHRTLESDVRFLTELKSS